MKFYKLIPFIVFISIVLAPQVFAFKHEDLEKIMSTLRCPKCDRDFCFLIQITFSL